MPKYNYNPNVAEVDFLVSPALGTSNQNKLQETRTAQPTTTPTQNSFITATPSQRLNNLQTAALAANKMPQSLVKDNSGSFAQDYLNNMFEVGTGLGSILTHPIMTGKTITQSLGDYAYNELAPLPVWQRPIRAAADTFVNLPLSTYNTTWQDITNIRSVDDLGEVLGQTALGARKRPFEASLDLIPAAGLAKRAASIGKKASKTLSATQRATQAIDLANKEVGSVLSTVEKNFKDIAKGSNPADFERAIQSLEEGTEVTGEALRVKQALVPILDNYHDLVKKVSPSTVEDPEWQSITQAILREEERKGIPTAYQSVQKDLQVYKDIIDETPQVSSNIATKVKDMPDSISGGLVELASQTGRTLEDLTSELPVVTHKAVNNTKQIQDIKPESIIEAEGNFSNQSQKVQEALIDIIGNENLNTIRRSNGDELYNLVLQKTQGDTRKASDLLNSKGIDAIKRIGDVDSETGKLTENLTVFNGTKKGGYNPKKNTIDLFNKSDDITFAHEGMHWFVDKLEKLNPKSEMLVTLKRSVGLEPTSKMTRQAFEDISDIYQEFITKGTSGISELDDIFTKLSKQQVLTNNTDKLIEIKKLADTGDTIAQSILKYSDAYKTGRIKPVPHGLAKVTDKLSDVDINARKMSGRFSSRIYGTAKYSDIANELAKGGAWITKELNDLFDARIAKEILDNNILKDVSNKSEKEIAYISKSALEDRNLEKALSNVSDVQKNDDYVPVDRKFIQELVSQKEMLRGTNPFNSNSLLADLYTIGKASILSSGKYLVGNLQTGLANTALNNAMNPVGLIQDVASAARTGTDLINNLGIARRLSVLENKVRTPVLKQVNNLNTPIANNLNLIDTTMQNFFAETATHSALREAGIPFSKRVDYIKQINEAAKVSELVNNIRNVALLNSPTSVVPTQLRGALGIANPFWRWYETAAKSSYHMLKNRPFITNSILVDNLSRLGMQNEYEIRDNLMVESDKPYASYRFNSRTGNVEEISMEAIPIMNTLKLAGSLAQVVSGKGDKEAVDYIVGSGIPAISAIYNATKGLDKYGRPILRNDAGLKDAVAIQGNKRYVKNELGQWELDNKFYPSEIVAAGAKELLGGVNLVNKTVLPIAAGLASGVTGKEINYYSPFSNSIFGSFNPDNPAGVLFGGNPSKPMGGQYATDIILGLYATPYYQQRDFLRPSLNKSLNRSVLRENLKRYNYENRGGLE